MQHLLVLIDQLSDCGIELQHIDIGGGLGVCYQDEVVPSLDTYMASLLPLLQDRHHT